MSTAATSEELFDGAEYEYREVEGYKVEKVMERFSGSLERSNPDYLEWLKSQPLGSYVEVKVLMSLNARQHVLSQDADGGDHLGETVQWKIHSVTQG
jgi:hypothetical protein